jgi:hypothetical protein
MYIWFEDYNIRYVCMQYIRFEEYDASMGMNSDRWTSMEERGRIDEIRWMDVDGCQIEPNGHWTEL